MIRTSHALFGPDVTVIAEPTDLTIIRRPFSSNRYANVKFTSARNVSIGANEKREAARRPLSIVTTVSESQQDLVVGVTYLNSRLTGSGTASGRLRDTGRMRPLSSLLDS
jgi:hypothetical protein